jgi:tRNA (guanine-N7-)-methyltransferase
MARKKLERFAEIQTFPFYFETGYFTLQQQPFPLKGRWRKDFFGNDNPITLELACGKAEYTVEMAQRFANKNFIAIDIKSDRMWVGAHKSNDLGLKNVAFLRVPIGLIEHCFDNEEVDEIWITFPDPQPQSRVSKRLTSPRFINRYLKIIKSHGIIHLKTDDDDLFNYTLEVIKSFNFTLLECNHDVYKERGDDIITQVQTFYEKMWLSQGKTIKYLAFQI